MVAILDSILDFGKGSRSFQGLLVSDSTHISGPILKKKKNRLVLKNCDHLGLGPS